MKTLFGPGCALTIERPNLAEKILKLLNRHIGKVEMLDRLLRNGKFTYCNDMLGFKIVLPLHIVCVCDHFLVP